MGKFFTPSKLSENIRKTPEGFLLCLGVPVARTGWQEYGPGETPLDVGDDDRVWVYRDAKEVFRPQTIASFLAKSITIKHPDDFVSPQNWKDLTYGSVQNVRRGSKDEDGEMQLIADLLITDEMAIGLINNGLREVSCGYDAEYEQTGEGEGKQFNIIGNHIALVEQGRAGSTYAIRDHKGKVESMTLKELMDQVKKLGQTIDAMSESDEDKAKKAADLAKAKKKSKVADADESEKSEDDSAYDELTKAVKDIGEKLDAMASKKSDDEDMEDDKDDEDKEEPAKDDEESGVEGRIKSLEAAVAKILKSMGSSDEDEEESEDEEGTETLSGDEDESEESEDADEEEEPKKKKTGDAANIEILTPGKKFDGKDARVKCLKAFAKTEDGAKVLKSLGIKTLDSKSNTNVIFLAAASVVKAKRGVGLDGTKDVAKAKRYTEDDVGNTATESMTPEQMNEMNAKHYSQAK